MTHPSPALGAPPVASPTAAGSDAAGIGALRAVITLLVIAHHVVLIYHPFVPPPLGSLADAPYWQAFPVVDPHRWSGAVWLAGFNDTFFMSLMFLIAGLFVWRGLAARGPAAYLAHRARRLGLPFLVAAGVLAPLAYLPSHLQTAAGAAGAGFWRAWLALDTWPAGPAWFLWVLLAFDAIAALIYGAARRGRAAAPASGGNLARRSLAAFAVLVLASAAAYVPLALEVGAMRWSAAGPFAVQTSRVLHYAVYFAFGAALGAAGLERGFLAARGALARRWPLWVAAGGGGFYLAVQAATRSMAAPADRTWAALSALAFVAACAALCFAFLAVFVRAEPRATRLVASLRANAFVMYVVHYAVVSWLGYAFVPVELPGAAKAALVFGGAVGLSWAIAAASRAGWRALTGGRTPRLPRAVELSARDAPPGTPSQR